MSTVLQDTHYIVYLNDFQYATYLKNNNNFHLIFELSKKNRQHLFNIVNDCIEHQHFKGFIFLINKNEILFDRLFFLQNLILSLFKNNKQVGVWGIPHCVQQTIFGSYYFSQFSTKLIAEETKYFSKYLPTYQTSSSLLLECIECFDAPNCDGLGTRRENQYRRGYRTSHDYRKAGRDALFKSQNTQMQKLYDSFANYVDSSDLRYADRYLYFVNNVDFGSSYSFSDRFVYHCDFLPPHEYEKEFDFLETHIENKKILPSLRTLSHQGEICRLAYSKAMKEDITRESFYIIPNHEYNYYLLEFFDILLSVDFPNKFFGVGIDFYNGEIQAYKIYLLLTPDVLLEKFPHYLEKIDIDLLGLHEKEHYYIIRLDKHKKKISERVDVVYNSQDHKFFQAYLPYTKEALDKLHIFALAFEFESMDMKKMNIYYRNKF